MAGDGGDAMLGGGIGDAEFIAFLNDDPEFAEGYWRAQLEKARWHKLEGIPFTIDPTIVTWASRVYDDKG
jgi:hypothetical protein